MTSNQFFSQYKIYLSLAIVAISSWFLADFFEDKQTTQQIVADHSPDYFSSGYYKKEISEDGTAKNELTADKMIHYSDDGTTHLENPLMTLYNHESPPWVIKSKTGIIEADNNHLLLTGQVFISRKGTKKLRSFDIMTSELKVQLLISYAETEQWAELIDGSNKTQGIGMTATFVDPIKIKFLSKVKGRYEFN